MKLQSPALTREERQFAYRWKNNYYECYTSSVRKGRVETQLSDISELMSESKGQLKCWRQLKKYLGWSAVRATTQELKTRSRSAEVCTIKELSLKNVQLTIWLFSVFESVSRNSLLRCNTQITRFALSITHYSNLQVCCKDLRGKRRVCYCHGWEPGSMQVTLEQ